MKRKIWTMLITGLLMVGAFGSTVSAKETTPNTGDTIFSFYLFSGEGDLKHTEWRNKTNKTSTYIQLTDAPSDYTKCDVLGGKGAWSNNASESISNISVETYGTEKVKVSIGKWRIRQTIVEHGKNKACIRFYRDGENGVITGYWSPDCAGTYTSVN